MSDMAEAPRRGVKAPAQDSLSLLAGVSIRLSVEVGSTTMTLAELSLIETGSVITLDRMVHEPLDIFANGTRIARGEIVSADGKYGIRITELVAPDQRLAGVGSAL